MFSKFIRNVLSYNAPNDFEKSVSQATRPGDTSPPNEKDMQKILWTFSGKNPDIRGHAAFYLIIAKLQSNKSRTRWNYLMKNLVIMDKAIDEKYFTKEISELELPEIENHSQTNDKKMMSSLIKRYFRYIKAKGRLYNTKHLPFNLPVDQKSEYLETLDKNTLLAETKRLKSLVILALDIFVTGTKDNLSNKLNQHVFFQTFNTLVDVLTIQYIISIIILENLNELRGDFITDFYFTFKDLLKDIQMLHQQCDNFKFISGFQLPKNQICDAETCEKVIKSIEEYFEVLQGEGPDLSARLRKQSLNVQSYHPRLKCSEINLQPLVEVFHEKPKGDHIEVESDGDFSDEFDHSCDATSPYLTSPDRYASNKNTPDKSSSYKSSPSRYKSRSPSPQKLHTTKIFKESLKVGFRSRVATYSEEGELPKETIQGTFMVRAGSRANYFSNTPKNNLRNMENEQHLTSLFHQLLMVDEKEEDEFDSFQNFYSNQYLSKFEEQYEGRTERGSVRTLGRMKTRGYLPVNVDLNNFEYEVPIVQDYDHEIFQCFKNTFSKE